MLRIIAGSARGRRIEAPEGRDTRPTLDRVRENLFNMLQLRTRDARVLDLFAGSGALSLEAISRGAASAVLVDRDRNANRAELNNISALRFEPQTRVMLCDWHKATETLRSEQQEFDLIFLDPPYAMTDLQEVMNELRPLTAKEGLIVLEHEAKAVPTVPDFCRTVNTRSWGYCGVTFYQITEDESHHEDVRVSRIL